MIFIQNHIYIVFLFIFLFVSDRKSSEKRPIIFSFEISDIDIKNFPEPNQVELRVFKRRSKQRNSREFYYVHLYQIFDNNITNTSRENKRLLSSRFVRNARGEWLSFDVTSELMSREYILKTAKPSFMFEVNAVEERPKSKPVRIAKSGRKQPFILVFFQKNPEPLPTLEFEDPVELSLNKFPFGKVRSPRAASSGRANKMCSRRRSLRINFQQLGMNHIIAPIAYEAYYCDGVCPIYSSDLHETSLYSFLRNRQRLESGLKIPGACCVPTQLESLNVLYLNAKENIIMTSFPGMVVSSCGCR
jgi:bone morphogenetic protein 2/4